MKRSIAKRLAATLRRPACGRWLVASCLLRLPAAQTATAPVWSPGGGYLEASTALVWVSPASGANLRAVVAWGGADGDVLAEADVEAADVFGAGGLCDKPWRIRWKAEAGSLRTTLLSEDHPARRYRVWCDQVRQHVDDLLHEGWRRQRLAGDGVHLSRTRDGAFQVTVACS